MPPTEDTAGRYELALAVIREAGDHALGFLDNREALDVRSKGLQDLASEADVSTEVLIRRRIESAFPEDAFLGEETGASEFEPGQGIWVVDPIDGTQPYVSGLTGWCVSIAFVRNGELLFGMVNAPARGEIFAGGAGFPASLNGAPVGRHPGRSVREGITAVGYSPRVTPAEFMPMMGRLLEGGATFYRDGSGALALSYVAAGRLVGYIELHINSWDCLGALAVAHAAGLRSNDFLADDGLRKGNRLIVGNDEVYQELETFLEP